MSSGNLKALLLYTLIVFGVMVIRNAAADDKTIMTSLNVIIDANDEEFPLFQGSGVQLPPTALRQTGTESEPQPITLPQEGHQPSKKRNNHRINTDIGRPPRPPANALSEIAERTRIEAQTSTQPETKLPDCRQQIAQTEDTRHQLKDTQQALNTNRQKVEELEKQLAASTASLIDNNQKVEQLQQTLGKNQDKTLELRNKLASVVREADVRISEINELKRKVDSDIAKSGDNDAKSKSLQERIKEQNTEIIALKLAKSEPQSFIPQSNNEIRDYALGAYWAQEMEGQMQKKSAEGYHITTKVVLIGAQDMMNNQLKIAKDKLAAVLRELYKTSEDGNKQQQPEDEGTKFLKIFSEQPGVKQSPVGYYYKIINKGIKKIKPSNTVVVTIRENLWNGKVINDMSKKGTVLVLPLNKYPPLFKSAISLMNNHGSMQIAVPPELAYGKKGRQPLIPPNAVMLYYINIIDVTEGN